MAEFRSLYVIGSLRNPRINCIANEIRGATSLDVFDDWFAAGPHADDCWRDYERSRGHSFVEALQGHAAQAIFEHDRRHLERCDMALLVLPAGKSAHLELGWMLGRGKPGFILLDEDPSSDPDPTFRFDVMCRFATQVFQTLDESLDYLGRYKK